jgi:hypothetical protein
LNVYIVWHIHHFELALGESHRDEDGDVINLDEDEDLKVIGVYSGELSAGTAIERARLLEGFRAEPDCFVVSTYKLDEDKWTDGFITG